MKQVILKVPSFLFILLMFGPTLLWYFGIDLGAADIFLATRILPTLIGAIWLLSLVAYMSTESKSDEYVVLTQILIVCQVLIHITIPFIASDNPYYDWIIYLELSGFLLLIVNAIFITGIVKKVFYARSTWFLFIEVWILPIGVFTLTPDVQDWEIGDKT